MSQRGPNNPNWRGGRIRGGHKKQYWLIYTPEHPNASKQGYVLEHRLVVEKRLGRFLTAQETVHHKNGDHADNRIENLEVMSQSEHAKLHDSLAGRRFKRKKVIAEHVCEACGAAFSTWRSSRLKQRFCSKSCYWSYRKAHGGQLQKGQAA